MRRAWVLAVVPVCLLAWSPQAQGAQEFPVPPPPLSENYYPCMQNCHTDIPTDPMPRKLQDEHAEVELHHAEQFRWCLDCHDATDRDKLHLQSGEKLDFAESYRLCGQCHGTTYRDWRAGIHGKRTGYWDGAKEYLLCAHCHNPHDPRFVLRADPKNWTATADRQPEPPPEVPGSRTLRSRRGGPAGTPH